MTIDEIPAAKDITAKQIENLQRIFNGRVYKVINDPDGLYPHLTIVGDERRHCDFGMTDHEWHMLENDPVKFQERIVAPILDLLAA